MKVSYLAGYSDAEEITVKRIESNLGLLSLITDTGVVYEAEFMVDVNGETVAHLSENA